MLSALSLHPPIPAPHGPRELGSAGGLFANTGMTGASVSRLGSVPLQGADSQPHTGLLCPVASRADDLLSL